MNEYKLFKSRKKAIKLIVLSSIFVAVGSFLLRQPGTSPFMAWGCILFFGLGLLLGLYHLLDRRPQIIVNEFGIFDRTVHKDFINWEIIHDAYGVRIHQERFICLVVDEQFEPSKGKGKLTQTMAHLSKAIGFQELNINVSNVSVDPARLQEFILSMRTADKAGREELITNALPHRS